MIWGVHPVLEILKNRPQQVSEVLIHRSTTGVKLQEILRLAALHGVKISYETGPGKAGGHQQGVKARVAPFATISLADLIEKGKAATGPECGPPILLALDCLQDPNNLGAIIRSALAAGVLGVIMTKDRSAPLSGTVAKASAGAVARMDICRVTNLAAALQDLKKEGVWVFGLVKDADLAIYQADFSSPVCLVVGGEEKGLRPLVRQQCDLLVAVPMQSGIDSLNASVAAAVALFEIARQRRSRPPATAKFP